VGLRQRRESPNGARDSASYICQHPATYDFQHARPASVHQAGIPPAPQEEQRGPRRETFWASFCRPIGAGRFLHGYPRLTPWAAFLRRFAAGFAYGLHVRERCLSLSAPWKSGASATTSGVPLARHRTDANLGDSSTHFPGNKKRPGRNPNSLPETHGHDRRTIVTQPEIFKTPGGVLALRIRNINARIVAIAAGFEAKQFALMQVKKRSRAARIGALRKHFRRSLGRGNVLGELNFTTDVQNSNLLFLGAVCGNRVPKGRHFSESPSAVYSVEQPPPRPSPPSRRL
jgi:hypothetical protein